ncbi:hypothetical protein JTE90_029030 [Oedothorax gibbosus]|uniref:Major facilitator superfamily (MFS) profile domain-containing protein n=1 Tax=Oedothorax gibbosus TaxID=931172 RepID=A0AAV6UJX2_9ARAC|nr:hypothetical protein JTE90_029030 [Oedothorax gibbosus]
MDFEDVLLEVGDYGKYQRQLIVYFLVPAATLLPWFSMNILFMVSVPEHWCNVPELVSSNFTIEQQRSFISPPGEKCHRYNLNFTDVLGLENFTVPNGTTTRPCDEGWQYDHTFYDSTAATQWDMVCDDSHYTSFVLSMYNVGSIICTPIYGVLSDKIGRRPTFFITIIVTAVTGLASVLVKDFLAFIIIKTINGSLMPSVFQLPYIIILEIVSPEMRTRMNGIVNLSWTFGLCFLPLLAYYSRTWITLGLCTSAVTLIFLFYYTFLPESPRWLVSQERYKEAADIMYKIGEKNGKSLEKKDLVQKLQKLGEKMQKEIKVDGVNNSSGDLLRYPQLRKKFIIITFCWISNIMSYYGLQINISNLAGNEFVNFFLLAIVEIPGYLTSWLVMEKLGRRWCAVAGFLLTGIVCMMPSFDLPYIDVVCSMLGKFFAAGTFMATYQQSSELYPTVVRSIGMGMSSTVAMVATLIVPYLIYLGVYGKAIPFVVIGSTGIIAGVMAAFLPETLNENLPQSIFDAEDFGRKQKFFSMNRRRRSLSRERAQSIGLKNHALNTISGNESNASKLNLSSQILQNIEFTPTIGNSCVPQDSMNSEIPNIRYRNSIGGSNKDSLATDNLEAQRRDSSDRHGSGGPSDRSVDPTSVEKLPSEADSSQQTSDKFSYMNLVFYNKDDAARSGVQDGVVLKVSGDPGLSEGTAPKRDV